MIEIPLLMFLAVCVFLLAGFPVALTLAGVGLVFATLGTLLGVFDVSYLSAIPTRIFGTIGNETLIAVPLFILMGNILERLGVNITGEQMRPKNVAAVFVTATLPPFPMRA